MTTAPLVVGLDVSAAAVERPTGVALAIRRLALALDARDDTVVQPFLRRSRRKSRHTLPELSRAPEWILGPLFRRRDIGLFHGPDTRLPAGLRRPMVATIHDFSALHPAGFSRPSFARTRLKHYESAVRRSRRIIVYTAAIAAEVVERFEVERDRIDVVPLAPAADRAAVSPVEEPERPFLLLLGELSRRKNSARALRAFGIARQLSAAVRERELKIVGRPGFGAEEVEALLASAPPAVRRLGYVSDDELAALLTSAETLLFPSRYEGFGLPALEAMAAGTAVIAGDCGALREISGDAARLVDPESDEALAEAIVELCETASLRADLVRRGRARAGEFSWQRSAELARAAYSRALFDA